MSPIHDCEGSLTTANLPSGGGGATANTDIFLQASQSLGKRITETAGPSGFLLIDAADNDCSAADVHVGFWAWVTHYGILDDFRVILASGTGSPTNYDSHTFPYATEYPKLGGWLRLWTDVSRTPETPGGSGLNEAALRSYGVQISFTAGPGGSAANLMLDRADFIAGPALTLTGTTGLWTDFTTADQNTSNQYGVMRLIGGVYNCFARVQLGSSGSSLVMNESSFAVVFPMQTLVNDTFMGINVDIQNASTNIDWAGGVLKSASTKQGDLVVIGTSGTFDASNMTFSGLRIATLTSAVTMTGCSFVGSGTIDLGGAPTFQNISIVNPTGTVAMNVDAVSELANVSNIAFNGAGVGGAGSCAIKLNLGAVGGASLSLTGITFTNRVANSHDVLIPADVTGHLTITVTGGGDVPTINDGRGKAFTGEADDDFITCASHGLNDTDKVTLQGTSLPTPLTAATTYYVRDKTANTFKLATSSGGTAINITVDGSGTVCYYDIVAAYDVTLEGIIDGSEVDAYLGTDPATATLIANNESTSGDYTFPQSYAGSDGYIVVFALGYLPITIPITYSGADKSIPVQQVVDRQYIP